MDTQVDIQEDDMQSGEEFKDIQKRLKDSLDASLNELKSILLEFEPITVLIYVIYHKYIIALKRAAEYNPTDNPSCAPLELIQALILKHEYKDFKFNEPSNEEVKKIFDLAFKCCGQFGWASQSDDLFIQGIQNYTALVRGESYSFQRIQFMKDVLSDISTKGEFGFELSEVVDILHEDITKLFFKKGVEIASQIKDGKEHTLKEFISAQVFTLSDLQPLFPKGITTEQIKSLFDKMSLKFGDLASKPDEHIFLDNPVQSKPIICISDGCYFAGHLTRMFTNSRKILENLLGSSDAVQKQYREAVRPRYLENKLGAILKQSFPNAIHLQNGEFYCGGVRYENDHTVIIGNKALIFEAKAGRFKDSVYRGSAKSFNENYQKNVIYASTQANRFEEYLKSKTADIEITTANGKICVDTSQITEYIKFNVILDYLPANPLDRRSLLEYAKANSLEENANPTFVISDLEIVADVLDNEILLLDYFVKRYNLNFNDDFPLTMCDEMDLLAVYLSTGLNLSFKEKYGTVCFSGMSSDMGIDGYYDLKEKTSKARKPKTTMNERLGYIINAIYASGVEYVDVCLTLLGLPFDDKNLVPDGMKQSDFIRAIDDGLKKAKTTHFWHSGELNVILFFHHDENMTDIENFIRRKIKYNNEAIIEFDTKRIHKPFTRIFRL